jgi:hypothetical protein
MRRSSLDAVGSSRHASAAHSITSPCPHLELDALALGFGPDSVLPFVELGKHLCPGIVRKLIGVTARLRSASLYAEIVLVLVCPRISWKFVCDFLQYRRANCPSRSAAASCRRTRG